MNRSHVTNGWTRLIMECSSDRIPRLRNNEAFSLGFLVDGWFFYHSVIVIGLQRCFLNVVVILAYWSLTFRVLRCAHAISGLLVSSLAVIAALSFEIPTYDGALVSVRYEETMSH